MRKAIDAKGFFVFTESGAANAGSHGELCRLAFYFHGLSKCCLSLYCAQRFCKSFPLPCLLAHYLQPGHWLQLNVSNLSNASVLIVRF